MENGNIVTIIAVIVVIGLVIFFESGVHRGATTTTSIATTTAMQQSTTTVQPSTVINDSNWVNFRLNPSNYTPPAYNISGLHLYQTELSSLTSNITSFGYVNNSVTSFYYSNSVNNQSMTLGTYLFVNSSSASLAYNGLILEGDYLQALSGNINITSSLPTVGTEQFAAQRLFQYNITEYNFFVLKGKSVVAVQYIENQGAPTVDPYAVNVLSSAALIGYNYTVGPSYLK